MNLLSGSTVGIIALAGSCESDKVKKAQQILLKMGFKVKLSKNIFDKKNYLAGCDEDKISELEAFFQDEDIDIIMAARGGYGSIRLINGINYEIIKQNPKPICGFSDITALLLMIYKKTGNITYHAPMACTDFAVEDNEFTFQNFFAALSGKKLVFIPNKVYKNGMSTGIIWGGNLTTVVSLCGLDFIPNENFIFFAEDLNEPVYKIDRMFQQLLNIDKFRHYCQGIMLGEFLDVDNADFLEQYFSELANRDCIPVAGGFKITHGKDKITLPIGKKAIWDGKSLYIN